MKHNYIISCALLEFNHNSFDVIILQSVARSVASQIMIEETLASCAGGPRGNEQLRVFAFLFYILLKLLNP